LKPVKPGNPNNYQPLSGFPSTVGRKTWKGGRFTSLILRKSEKGGGGKSGDATEESRNNHWGNSENGGGRSAKGEEKRAGAEQFDQSSLFWESVTKKKAIERGRHGLLRPRGAKVPPVKGSGSSRCPGITKPEQGSTVGYEISGKTVLKRNYYTRDENTLGGRERKSFFQISTISFLL